MSASLSLRLHPGFRTSPGVFFLYRIGLHTTSTSNLLSSGYLTANGAHLFDGSGNPAVIESIAWYGTQGPAGTTLAGLASNNPSDPQTAAGITSALQAMADGAFDTVRISWSDVDGKMGLATEGDLSAAGTDPVTQTVGGSTVGGKVVYPVHEYPSTIGGEPADSGMGYVAQMNSAWGC